MVLLMAHLSQSRATKNGKANSGQEGDFHGAFSSEWGGFSY